MTAGRPPGTARPASLPVSYEPPDDVRDPANGAKIPRCKACGMPNPIDLVGVRGGLRGRFPICNRCWFEVNPPDPLDVSSAA